jgi:hypothetical protein
VFDELVEEEQPEEECRVRYDEPRDQVVADELAQDSDENREEREESHIGAVIPDGCDREVVYGIPSSPYGQQQVARFLHVLAGSLADDDSSELGDDDDGEAGRRKIDQYVPHGLVEARGHQELADREDSDQGHEEAGAARQRQRQDERKPEQDERDPGDRVVLERSIELDPGTPCEVGAVRGPRPDGEQRADNYEGG